MSSNDDDKDEEDDDDEDSSSDEEVDEIGDPSKGPGEGCTKPIPEDYLQPFYSGWRRELVYRLNTKNGAATQCDVYYIPPQDGRYRTREAKRKRRSKEDQERYFDDFPDNNLSTKHFNYIRKPLGLENAAYEIIRRTKTKGTSDSNDDDSSQTGRKSMKEVKASSTTTSVSSSQKSTKKSEIKNHTAETIDSDLVKSTNGSTHNTLDPFYGFEPDVSLIAIWPPLTMTFHYYLQT